MDWIKSHLVLERIHSSGQYKDSLVTIFCSGKPDMGSWAAVQSLTKQQTIPFFLSGLDSNNNQIFPIHTTFQKLWKAGFP